MDIKQIKKLINVVRQNEVAELEVKDGNESIHIVLNKNAPIAGVALNNLDIPERQGCTVNLSDVNQSVMTEEAGFGKSDAGAATFSEEDLVVSPMVGMVYLSSSPDSEVFVKVGDTVQAGDTLCLIEAMKMFNRIEASKGGVVTHILVQNTQSVEYGQQLFVIE